MIGNFLDAENNIFSWESEKDMDNLEKVVWN